MIKLENISKVYGNNTIALQGIDLDIQDGEFITIMGTSGSGKTTLLNILGGLDTATTGKYLFNGENIADYSIKQLHQFRKENISFVFQHFELMKQYTVYENVEMPLLARNIKNRKPIVEKYLEELEILNLKDKLPIHLSGGQQQRCAIARALVCDTNLILADEPTGALDSKNTQNILSILKQVNKMNKTIVLITHDYNVAKQCDRIVKIEDGKIV
jgi:putative ABC transport system ATP-binding protein